MANVSDAKTTYWMDYIDSQSSDRINEMLSSGWFIIETRKERSGSHDGSSFDEGVEILFGHCDISERPPIVTRNPSGF